MLLRVFRVLLAASVFLTFCRLNAFGQKVLLTSGDISAGIANAGRQIDDCRLKYRVTRRFLRRAVWDQSEVSDSRTGRKKTVLAYRKATEEELKKVMRYDYSYLSSGDMFIYDMSMEDEINGRKAIEKHAFNGSQHLNLTDGSGWTNPVGGIKKSNRAEGGCGGETVRPEQFFLQLDERPLTDWAADESATVSGVEEINGRLCHVIDAEWERRQATARIWICVEMGFRPLKMEIAFEDGRKRVFEVEEMKEILPGVWYPLSAVQTVYVNDPASGENVLQSDVRFEADADSIDVNLGVDSDAFTFEFPAGTEVYDANVDRVLTVGAVDSEVAKIDAILESLEEVSADEGLEVNNGQPPENPGAREEEDVSADQREEPANANGLSAVWWGPLLFVLVIVAFAAFLAMKKRITR